MQNCLVIILLSIILSLFDVAKELLGLPFKFIANLFKVCCFCLRCLMSSRFFFLSFLKIEFNLYIDNNCNRNCN